jgi:hypothetical protein
MFGSDQEIFGARLDDGEKKIRDLFSFCGNFNNQIEDEFLGNSGNGSLMNAFKHQGNEFKEDPFSFKPAIPENYKPFEFGCFSNR